MWHLESLILSFVTKFRKTPNSFHSPTGYEADCVMFASIEQFLCIFARCAHNTYTFCVKTRRFNGHIICENLLHARGNTNSNAMKCFEVFSGAAWLPLLFGECFAYVAAFTCIRKMHPFDMCASHSTRIAVAVPRTLSGHSRRFDGWTAYSSWQMWHELFAFTQLRILYRLRRIGAMINKLYVYLIIILCACHTQNVHATDISLLPVTSRIVDSRHRRTQMRGEWY